jgi:hypothetical protein
VLLSAADNVARFDHNPVTGESLGLLIEEQRTNLLTRSEEFNDAAWTKTASSITANTIVAPDGTLTGDKLVEDTSTGGHLVLQSVTLADSTTYTVTVFAKAAERTWVAVGLTDKTNTNNRVWFNASTGAQGTTNGTVSAASATSVGNGWWRFSASVSSATGATTPSVRISLGSADNTASYTGDGYSGIYIWGAQLEAGAFPTSYIATVASQVTRSADAASMTGANFSSWYNAAEGTLYAEAQTVEPSGTFDNVAGVYVGSAASLQLARNGTNSRGFGLGASIDQGSNTFPVDTSVKQALAGQVNNFALSTNGSAVATDTVTDPMPSNTTSFNIGSAPTGGAVLNGTIKKIAYYPKRLTNAELQGLTS